MNIEGILKTEPLGIRGSIAQAFPYLLCGVLKGIEVCKNEKYVVTGTQNITKSHEPTLWLPKHDSWDDLHNLGSLWWKIGKPPINGMARTKYFSNTVGSWLADTIMSNTVFVPLIRKKEWNGTEEERQRLNSLQLARLKTHYQRGIDLCIAAEGTSKSNGEIMMPRNGAYNVSQVDNKSVRCVPIGNTMDRMSGNKNRVFLNIGDPFYNTGSTSQAFNNILYGSWAKLNTFTLSQLAGYHIYNAAKNNQKVISFGTLATTFSNQADMLKSAGYHVDEDLVDSNKREHMWGNYLINAVDQNYLNEEGILNRSRILEEPTCKDWKKENILLYDVNRVKSVANIHSRIREILEI